MQNMKLIILTDHEKELIKEFQKFRRDNTATCNAIRLDEVVQFVLYKTEKITQELVRMKSDKLQRMEW